MSLEAPRASLGEGGEHHLGVALGTKDVTESLQLGAELEVVVDFAVVRQPIAVAVDHRLRRRRAQFDDRQALMSEGDLPRGRFGRANHRVAFEAHQANAVWPAVRNPISHRARERQRSTEIFPLEQGDYPTHAKLVSAPANPSP
jgi:hypothetical protein